LYLRVFLVVVLLANRNQVFLVLGWANNEL
jgi:hypothetical protein